MLHSNLDVPSVKGFANRVLDAPVRFADAVEPLRHWVETDRQAAHERRHELGPMAFHVFAAALLERNVSGSSYLKRIDTFRDELGDPSTLTAEHAEAMLRRSGYRYPRNGAATLLKVRDVLQSPGFSWTEFFARAEREWEGDFTADPLFEIKGIGPKTRNFALSEFSDYYCAPDLHVCRMMARTGLILHGYGDPSFSTDNPGFVRKVIVALAKETGFPNTPGAFSPAFLDRMFWYYGQDRRRCDATPDCKECPARDVCLTGKMR